MQLRPSAPTRHHEPERSEAPRRRDAHEPESAATAMLALQRGAGNASVSRLLRRCTECGGTCSCNSSGGSPARVAREEDGAEAMPGVAEVESIVGGATSAGDVAGVLEQFTGQISMPDRQREGKGGKHCEPYDLPGEMVDALESWSFLVGFLPAAATAMYQSSDVGAIWWDYLVGRSGQRRSYSGQASMIVRGFETSEDTIFAHQFAFDEAIRAFQSSGRKVPPTGDLRVPLADLRPDPKIAIHWGQPFDIPGHIAGGEGEGAGGDDRREVGGDLIVRRQVDLTGKTTGYQFISDFVYRAWDTVDLCPGDSGAGFEEYLTIPLSRLEKTGTNWARDVPFDVTFRPAPLTKSLPPGALPDAPNVGDEREFPFRDPDQRDTRDIRTPVDRRDDVPRLGEGVMDYF